MPSDHPPSPQSPSQHIFDSIDLPHKPTTSPRVSNSLPTPAHSINGSMSSHQIDHEGADNSDVSNKRKRELEDSGDREQKKVHVEDSRISIKDLHLDVGQKYLLCRTRKTPFFPRDILFLRLVRHCLFQTPCLAFAEVLVNMDSVAQLILLVPCHSRKICSNATA